MFSHDTEIDICTYIMHVTVMQHYNKIRTIYITQIHFRKHLFILNKIKLRNKLFIINKIILRTEIFIEILLRKEQFVLHMILLIRNFYKFQLHKKAMITSVQSLVLYWELDF